MFNADDQIVAASDREKWDVDKRLREREVAIKEGELELRRKKQGGSSWRNPLVVAILAATAAAAGNAVVALVNGRLERGLESQKAEDARILETIKTGDPDQAADNLQFLLKAGLIDNAERAQRIQKFLEERTPGTGPALPTASGSFGQIKPGIERWSVKTGADADAALVGQELVQTTIKNLVNLPAPDIRDPRFQEHRLKPVETTIYSVEGTVIAYKEEMSGDYHLILADDSGETMIVAAPNPDPSFVSPSSRWAKEIAIVHRTIKDRLNPTSRFTETNLRVRVNGLGYFSYRHGARGEAKNAIQLHPVTGIEFR